MRTTKTNRKNIVERILNLVKDEKMFSNGTDEYVVVTPQEFEQIKEKMFENLNADLSKNLEVWTNTTTELTWFRTYSECYGVGFMIIDPEEDKEDNEMKMDEAKTIVMENIKGACEHFFKAWAEDDELKPATTEEVKDLLWEESTSNAWTPDYTDGQIDEAIQTVDMNWVMDIVDELVETLKKNKEDETMAKINEREETRTNIRNNYTVKEMREQLKEAGIAGTSKMKKDELVEMMLDLEEKCADRKDKKTKINKVNMYAFTGMLIGEFDAEVQDGKILVYTERKGELMFDLNTGKELTEESKARYANRVEAV